MNIPVSEARNLFTKAVADLYREIVEPTAFLRSFFPSKEFTSKLISIQVKRGKERIAVDVLRGSDGNRNEMTIFTEKVYLPPYYREYFDATEMMFYDRFFGSEMISEVDLAAFVREIAEGLVEIKSLIERAYEKQCAEVLTSGIVTLKSGDNIDFKRKPTSMVDPGGGAYWSVNGVDPNVELKKAAVFLRKVGKCVGGVFNVILGADVLPVYLNNEKVQNRGKIYQYGLDQIQMAQRNAVGATFHGEVSVDSYRMRLWAYEQFYDTETQEQITYLDPKKVIVLPESPRFGLHFAGVPQLMLPGQPIKKGAFIFNDYIDPRKKTHEFDVESAGIAVPVAIDQIYTFQALPA